MLLSTAKPKAVYINSVQVDIDHIEYVSGGPQNIGLVKVVYDIPPDAVVEVDTGYRGRDILRDPVKESEGVYRCDVEWALDWA